jgi:hypothetical protein
MINTFPLKREITIGRPLLCNVPVNTFLVNLCWAAQTHLLGYDVLSVFSVRGPCRDYISDPSEQM